MPCLCLGWVQLHFYYLIWQFKNWKICHLSPAENLPSSHTSRILPISAFLCLIYPHWRCCGKSHEQEKLSEDLISCTIFLQTLLVLLVCVCFPRVKMLAESSHSTFSSPIPSKKEILFLTSLIQLFLFIDPVVTAYPHTLARHWCQVPTQTSVLFRLFKSQDCLK